ncbi:MAG: DegT/DnrJ/EryC1/StrS family aminotransferase [Actinobacteria bacterium]|nr:DegT/DnrJ/EryC1/StrS family aminotransferase [Actinomycetota bacterium]
MKFIDLEAQQKLIRGRIEGNIKKVLDHGKYILGPEVRELEEKLADYVGAKFAVGCSSGTDALLMSLMSYGVGAGDYIITTPFTFIATAEVVSLLGAKPVFVDIDKNTYNIDPGKIEGFLKNPLDPATGKCINPGSIRGIIAVDIFGLPADYESINRIAEKYNLFVIEDAAQSFGAEYKMKKVCSLADVGCTSFFPAKPLGCYGDGGMIFTDDEQVAQKLKSISVHGKGGHKYENVRIGLNGRLDTIQAAVLLAKFDLFPKEIDLRQEVAARYNDALGDKFYLQVVSDDCISAWAQYSVRPKGKYGKTRDDYIKLLGDSNIPTAIYYPKSLHLQGAFQSLSYNEYDFPFSKECTGSIFSLPFYPYIKKNEQEEIISLLLKN